MANFIAPRRAFKTALCGLLFCTISFGGITQSAEVTAKIDSFIHLLGTNPNDSIYGEALTSLASIYLREVADGIDSSQHYAVLGAQWGGDKKIVKVHAESLDLLGEIWRDKQNKEKSVSNYQAAHDLFMSVGDTSSAIKMKGNIASSLISFGEVEDAIKIKLENIDAFAKMKDSTALMIEYYGIGYAYSTSQLEHKALPYYLEAAKHKDHPLVLGTIGRHYATIGKIDSAYYYLEQGLKIAQPGSGFETDLLQKLGSIYFEEGKFPESIKQYKQALNNLGEDSKISLARRIRLSLTNAYIENEDITSARNIFNKVENKEDNKIGTVRYSEINYKLLAAEGSYKDAYNAHVKFKIANDSLADTDLKSRMEEIETKYETEKKELQIQNLEETTTKQHQQLWGGGIALGLISLLSFFLFRLYKKVASQKEIISKALSEKDLLLREIHHRVKNNLQLVSSLLTLQGHSIDDATAQQAINEGKSRVRSMALIHQDLYNKENLTGISVKDYIQKLTKELFYTYSIDSSRINLEIDIDEMEIDVDTLIPMGLILNELITNSLKYAFPNDTSGNLLVGLKEKGKQLHLIVKDDGIGYDPSQSRKNSFGATLISSLTEQLEGEMTITTDNGTTVLITINKEQK